MKKYLLCIFLLFVIFAYAEGSSHHQELAPLRRSLCFFHNLCNNRHRSVSAFCGLLGNWQGLDGSRMKAACENGDIEEEFEDEDEDYEEEHEDDDDEDEDE